MNCKLNRFRQVQLTLRRSSLFPICSADGRRPVVMTTGYSASP